MTINPKNILSSSFAEYCSSEGVEPGAYQLEGVFYKGDFSATSPKEMLARNCPSMAAAVVKYRVVPLGDHYEASGDALMPRN